MPQRFRVPAPPRLHPAAALALAVALPLLASLVESRTGDLFARSVWAPFFPAVAVAAWAGGFLHGVEAGSEIDQGPGREALGEAAGAGAVPGGSDFQGPRR